MRSRRLLPSVAGLALAVGACPPMATAATPIAAGPADDRPNIVLITTDDQTVVDLTWMPQTRALLGDVGVTLTDAIAPNPVCGPSRATLLTGQHSHNHGIHGNDSEQDFLDRTRTLPVWLHDGGYRTGFVGKYLNRYRGSAEGEPGWNSFNAVTNGARYFGYTMSNDGDPVTYDDVHVDDTVAAGTRALVESYAPRAEPFFIWSSYSAPHGVCRTGVPCDDASIPAARHAGLYPDVRAPQLAKPSFNERNMSDKPRRIRRLDRADAADVQHDFTERIRTLASVDEGIADTVAALAESGELDNTLIVFTSDNGFQLGEHRHTGKVLAYEESLAIPLLVRGPGIPAGVVRDQPVTMADLAPTVAAAGGVAPTRLVDGRDLRTILVEDARKPYTAVVETGLARNDWTYRGVRTGRYTFVRWANGERELYDRRLDPFELRNRVGGRRYGAVESALAQRLRALASCAGPECAMTFRALPDPGPH